MSFIRKQGWRSEFAGSPRTSAERKGKKMEKFTNDEAIVIFHDALRACGNAIMVQADDLAEYGYYGMEGDDGGDGFTSLVNCVNWLEYILNNNQLDDPAVYYRGQNKPWPNTWLADVLNWAVSNKAQWEDPNASITLEATLYNAPGTLYAWGTAGAPHCRLYDLLNPEEE